MMASRRSLARAMPEALVRPSASSMRTSRPMRFDIPSFVSNCVSSTSNPPDVTRRARFGHDDHVERFASAGDHLDDVAVAPGRLDAVDAHGTYGPAPVEVRQCFYGCRAAPSPWRPVRMHLPDPRRRDRRPNAPTSRTCARCWQEWRAPSVSNVVAALSAPKLR